VRPAPYPLGRSEEGSALIIALVFVTAFSLIVAGVLSFADVGLRASRGYQRAALSAYTADAAITAATKRYASTGPCDNFTAPLVEPASPGADTPINGQGVIVRCEGPAPAASKATQPINSLLSLGTHPDDDGITTTEELRLLGDVYSTTTVDAGATMVVQGAVSAVGACTGAIQASPPLDRRCAGDDPPADQSQGRDPDYTKATTVVPVRRSAPVPTAGCAGSWLITLAPGYYDDADALTALTGAGSCNDKVVWFQPGTYYFDFTFRGVGSDTWTVANDRVVVVAGVPRGWTADPALPAAPKLDLPGTCRTEGDGPPFDGVQMIAGGGSRLKVGDAGGTPGHTKGRMELCATPSESDQQIALFGLRDELGTHVLEGSDITAVGFTKALDAQVLDETPAPLTADATLSPTKTSASLAYAKLRPYVPLGSRVEAVSLVVKHQETGNPIDIDLTVDFPGTPPSGCGPAVPYGLVDRFPTMGESRIDLTVACGLDTPEEFAGLAVTYAASLQAGSTDAVLKVDGLVVEVDYATPTTRKPTVAQIGTTFSNPGRALEIGERPDPTADAALDSGNPSASITLAGIGDPPLPAGATVETAVLRVAHQDVGDTGGPTVTVPFTGGACTNLPVAHRPDAVTDDRIDLKACGLDSPAELKGLTATFSATLDPGGTAATSRLDGLWLEVVASGPAGPLPPALRRAANAGSGVFLGPDLAKFIGETPAPLTADAPLSGATTSAALSVDDFNSIPLAPGSTISSAKLRVDHEEDANVGAVRVDAVVPTVDGLGGPCPQAFANSGLGTPATDFVDLVPCGLHSPDQLAGLSAVYSATRTETTTPANQVPTTVPATVEFDQADAQTNGRSINGFVTTTKLNGPKTTASVTLTGYNEAPPPAGSLFGEATLRIAHRELNDVAANGVMATVSFPGNTCTGPQVVPTRIGADLVVDTVNLQACGLTDPTQLNTLSVVFRVDRDPADGKELDAFLDGVELAIAYRPPAVDKLDGIELDVVYQPPTFRPLTGPADFDLVTVAPATTPLDTETRFVASGTIYAPSAGVDLKMYGLKAQVLRRGVVARAIDLGLRPDPLYKRPTGAIPPEIVNFTAYPDETMTPANVGAAIAFTSIDNARQLREQPVTSTADATLDGDPGTPLIPDTASLDLSGFDNTDLDSDEPLDGAVLRVRHQDAGNKVQVKVTKAGDPDPCVNQALGPNTANLSAKGHDGEDQIDLSPCLDAPSAGDPVTLAELDLADLTVTYVVTKDAATPPTDVATARLDGVTLELMVGAMVRASMTFDRAKPTVQEWSVMR
jgi:hypothetical protein